MTWKSLSSFFVSPVLAAARNQGSQQADRIAGDRGAERGRAEGPGVGDAEGREAGRKEGLLLGYKDGLQKGQVDGKSEGYQHGVNSPDAAEKGTRLGLEQGRKDALAEAQKTSYPKGRADRRTELFAVLPTNSVKIDNREQVPGPNGVRGELMEAKGTIGSSPFAWSDVSPLIAAAALSSDADEVIRLKIESTDRQLKDLAQANQAAATLPRQPADVPVDESGLDCRVTYDVFVADCQAAFRAAFRDIYTAAYSRALLAERNPVFERVRVGVVAENRPVRFAEGRDERCSCGRVGSRLPRDV
jgi:hypothetical protein